MKALIDGDYLDANGYVRKNRDTYAHRDIVEKILGRPLLTSEIIHHIDGDKSNNSNSNLVVCPSQAYHRLLHARQRTIDNGGDPNTEKFCGYHNRMTSVSQIH